ncbi:MAG: lipopolysaccharide transport periplasmic protein LptA [Gammaproteobacteria bacterium]|nr:lipopolysaccharide transport periplasmic protein LptA [Gammaproteobacteria bacterium]MDX2488068.1 lipopolysaccharide transport periplasmic protein LptA [Gammaproteobacteria bacterium]
MNFFSPIALITSLAIAGILFSSPVLALDSDKDAPVTINADTTDIDFRTGKRVLSGNVDITQGTLNIRADKIVLIYKGDEIDTATAYGKPVRFKQLPEGQKQMVHGEGITLELKQAKNLITLQQNAKITQGSNTITGKVIYYNTKTSKMTVKSQSSGTQKKSSASKQASSGKETGKKTESGRTRIVIQPGSIKK